ncbi:hypothetical protein BDV96DRAFT_597177 [Lophiotrema nucula]|uniref:Uncharacterized protein n=1 Tax=Lophiotrema nucula TaxID=690887 RepID=A0A6A5ZHH3_9PLEO|nr:hypothetical protein BDV96DRAFT_597177 [Lophiotrema nucula]
MNEPNATSDDRTTGTEQSRLTFNDLPFELRRMVYAEALALKDGGVEFSLDENGRLRGPPFISLLLTNKQTQCEAMEILFGGLCITFVDDEKPARFVIREFKKQVKAVDRQRIKAISISKLTAQGLVYKIPFGRYDEFGFLELPQREQDVTSYLRKILSPYSRRQDHMFLSLKDDGLARAMMARAIIQDLHSTMLLLSTSFPSLKQLQFTLDILECLPTTSDIDRAMKLMNYTNNNFCTPIVQILRGLRSFKVLPTLQLSIKWEDIIERAWREGATPQNVLTFDDKRYEFQRLFLHYLRQWVPAKSITAAVSHEE